MDRPTRPSVRRWPLWAKIVGGIVALATMLLLTLATMPLGWLRGPVEGALSARLGRTVTIGSVARLDAVSLAPRIAIRDLAIGQPGWAGPSDMVRLRTATFRLALMPALTGRVRPREVEIDGLRLALVRDPRGRTNWESGGGGRRGERLDIRSLQDARISLRDETRGLVLAATAIADGGGTRVDGRGTHHGRPAEVSLRGAALGGTGRWPFRARFASPLVRATADGATARPFDFAHLAARVAVAGDDLQRIDELIQAGLPGTQAARLTGEVRRDGDVWTIGGLRGTLGRSDVAGDLRIEKQGERTRVDGRLASRRMNFDDITSDAGLAKGAAERARLGERVIPSLKIDLRKLARTDGRLEVTIRRVVSAHESAIRAGSGVLTLDRSRLEAHPLRMALAHGSLSGRATIDQRRQGPVLTLDLALSGARLEDFIAGNRINGPLEGRIALSGSGGTMRDALARADGTIKLTARGGSMERTVAEVLGRNAGAAVKALLDNDDARTPLRCAGLRLRGTGGVLRPELFAIDTAVMSATGRGAIDLDGERLSLVLSGRSRHPGLAQLPAPITIEGTLSAPIIETADAGLGSATTILKTLGSAVTRLVKGRADPPAPAMDCAALLRRARQ